MSWKRASPTQSQARSTRPARCSAKWFPKAALAENPVADFTLMTVRNLSSVRDRFQNDDVFESLFLLDRRKGVKVQDVRDSRIADDGGEAHSLGRYLRPEYSSGSAAVRHAP